MIKGLLVWQNPDSTRDLNNVWGLVRKGMYQGGTLTASGSSLAVTIAPFIAKSHDGMTCVSDATETVYLTPGTTQYIVLFAKYEIPTSTTRIEVISELTWQSSVNRDYFVTLARCVTPALAVAATSATIRYEEADYSDKLGQSAWRSPVANFAALPSVGNHAGDVRLTVDTYNIYTWNATTQVWDPMGMATNLTEDSSRNTLQEQVENFALSTSGLIGGVLDDPNDHIGVANYPGVGIKLVQIGAPNQLGTGAIHAYVHGHFIKQRAQTLALPTAPGVGSRYDLMYLEVWQETLPTALGLQYLNSAGGNQTLTSVLDAFNTCLEADLGPNQRIEQVQLYDNTTLMITKSAVRFQQNVPSGSIATPSLAMATTNNQFGNPYAPIATFDRFAYVASAPGVLSQRTWAIPLLVLKRRSVEGNFTVFAGDERYAFDIAPRATLGRALTETLHTASVDLTERELVANKARPSGFLTTAPLVLGTSVTSPEVLVRVKGHELLLPETTINMITASATGGRRDIFFVDLHCTHSQPNNTTANAVGGTEMSIMTSRGTRMFSWYGVFKSSNVTVNTDEVDSMTALGYTQVAGDVALWSRPATDDEPTRDGLVYALPIAIVHRRNSGVWNISTNPNGSTGRPDNAALSNPNLIDEREWVDLRRTIVRRRAVGDLIENSFDKLLDGTLRTRLQVHPLTSDVWGTSCLMTTVTSAVPVAGKHTMTPVPSASNAHTVWSDSEELIPLTYRLTDTAAPAVSADGVFSWNGAGDSGVMTITAPAGMYLLSSGSHSVDNYIVGPYSYQFSDAVSSVAGNSGSSFAIEIISSNNTRSTPQMTAFSALICEAPVVTPLATDPTNGYPTQVTAASTNWLSTGTSMMWVVWAVKPASSYAAAYSANGSLAGSPTKSYAATHGGLPINIGAIKATVTKIVTGTSFTITQAELFAARPDIASAAGNVRMYGVSNIKAVGFKALGNLRYVTLTNAGATAEGFALMRVEFANPAPANTRIDIEVMCDGDTIRQWIEIVPETRQIRGLYSYGYAQNTWNTTVGAGWSAPWTTTNEFVVGGEPRTASLADTSAGIQLGVMCGRYSTSNDISPKVNTPYQIDYVLAGYYPAAPGGYTFFYQASDAAGLGFPTGFNVGLRPHILSTYTDAMTPNHSPYANWMFVGGDNATPAAALMCLGVVQKAPTLAIELTYEIPAYQGMQTSSVLRSKLRGDVTIHEPLITTEGYGGSFHGRYMADGPTYQSTNSSGVATTGNYYTLFASRYRPSCATAIAAPSLRGTGEVASQVYSRSRRRVSVLRQVPYPAAPSTSLYDGYAKPATLNHSAISNDQLVQRTVEYAPIHNMARSDRYVTFSAKDIVDVYSTTAIRQTYLDSVQQVTLEPISYLPVLVASCVINEAGTIVVGNSYNVDSVFLTGGGDYIVFLNSKAWLPTGRTRVCIATIRDTAGTLARPTISAYASNQITVDVKTTVAGVDANASFQLMVYDIPDPSAVLLIDDTSRYYTTFSIPVGAVLEDVTVEGYNQTTGVISATLMMLNQESNIGGGTVIGTTFQNPAGTSFYMPIAGASGNGLTLTQTNNIVGFSPQVVGKNQNFAVLLYSEVATVIKSIRYTYTKCAVDVDRFINLNSVPTSVGTSGVDEMFYALMQKSPSSRLPRSKNATQAIRVDIPDTWSGAIENAMEASVFTVGASDYTGDWARGQCARYDNGSGISIYEQGLVGFVPYSGFKLQESIGMNPALPSLTDELPDTTPEKTLATAIAARRILDFSGAASITPSSVVNDAKELTLSVSVGASDNVAQNNINLPVGGSTIDGFWPVGRPVVEPD